MAFACRTNDVEKIDAYVTDIVPWVEASLEQAGEGKYLMGTDDLTLLDVYAGAMWDFIYCFVHKAITFSDAGARANLAENSPKWVAYMEMIRAHPKIAPVCMNLEVAER